MGTVTLSRKEFDALIAARDEAFAERETLRGEVRTLRVERDLLQEKLNAFLRKLFDAKSEARGAEQKDLFLNEAEALAPAGTPVAEEATPEIEIPAHTRKKRGRKPLDPNLPRDHLLDADLVHGDETVVQVLKEPGRAAQTKSYLWAQATGSGPPIRLFGYAPGRGAAHAATWYTGIKPGVALMSDGYEVYEVVKISRPIRHELAYVFGVIRHRR